MNEYESNFKITYLAPNMRVCVCVYVHVRVPTDV